MSRSLRAVMPLWPVAGLGWMALTVPACRLFQKSSPSTQALSGAHQAALTQVSHLLILDRATYTSSQTALAFERENSTDVESISKLRSFSPSDAMPNVSVFFAAKDDPGRFSGVLMGALTRSGMPVLGDLKERIESQSAMNHSGFRVKERNDLFQISAAFPGTFPNLPPKVIGLQDAPIASKLQDYALNVQDYVANRMTRGVFWDVDSSERPMEFHIGTFRDFTSRLVARNARIVAEVKPVAANYNKIFLVQNAGAGDLSYAIAPISGADRLKHLLLHFPVGRQTLRGASQDATAKVFGEPESFLGSEENRFALWLRQRPPASLTVIGQKGGFEKLFASVAQLREISSLGSAGHASLPPDLKVKHQQILSMGQAGFIPGEVESIDRIHSLLTGDKRTPMDFVSAAYTSAMFDAVDLQFVNGAGQLGILRVVSNVWGDEIRPIARALMRTGHRSFVYIGTAGALPGTGLEVGHLLVPSRFFSTDGGEVISLNAPAPQSPVVRAGVAVGEVSSPLLETRAWVEQARARGIQAVEVETFHLARELRGSSFFLPMLMVSDVLFSKHTLDSLDASLRQDALTISMETTLAAANVRAPARPLPTAMDVVREGLLKANVKANSAYVYFLLQSLRGTSSGVHSDGIAAIAREWPPFGERDVEMTLLPASELLWMLKSNPAVENSASVVLPVEFTRGTWHPLRSKLKIGIHCSTPECSSALRGPLGAWQGVGSKVLMEEVTSAEGPFIKVAFRELETSRDALLNVYAAAAYLNAGFVASEGALGEWRMIEAGNGSPLTSCPQELRPCLLR